jgi:hypothetical protein
MYEASEAAEAFKALTKTWPEGKREIVLVPEVVRDTAPGHRATLGPPGDAAPNFGLLCLGHSFFEEVDRQGSHFEYHVSPPVDSCLLN